MSHCLQKDFDFKEKSQKKINCPCILNHILFNPPPKTADPKTGGLTHLAHLLAPEVVFGINFCWGVPPVAPKK